VCTRAVHTCARLRGCRCPRRAEPGPAQGRACLSARGKSCSQRCDHQTGASQVVMDLYHCERQTRSLTRAPCEGS